MQIYKALILNRDFGKLFLLKDLSLKYLRSQSQQSQISGRMFRKGLLISLRFGLT